jgi:alpha-ketoglutarate-dependent taurine dioxygenase
MTEEVNVDASNINQQNMNLNQQQQGPMRNILQAVTQAAQESDLGRWLSSGARLLSTQRARLLRAEHDYATGRAKIVADAQHQLAELQQGTREALRRFDAEHEHQLDALRSDVARLEMMRESGEWPA